MKKPELLLPAGSIETALAAFDGGADAVYCGLSKFNARERAVNFSFPQLRTLLERAKSEGKKVYITFNTLLKSSELSEAAQFLAELAKTPPDALIVQDPGVIQLVNKYFPFFTLHASTQMGIHNSCGVSALEELNIKRVILERQITLDELKKIRRKSKLELEVFIHGSLCCSLSGRCLLSSYLGGTSGNRGRCKQPCRRCYAAVDNSKQDYFLSPYDLDGSSLVRELSDIGIDSFKVEGRLRGTDYIFKTARAYRLLIDHPDDFEAVSEARKLLESSSMRETSTGFYYRSDYKNIINRNRSGVFGIEAGIAGKSRNGTLALRSQIRLHLGDRLRLVNERTREDISFSLTRLEENGKRVIKCRPGAQVVIGTAPDVPAGCRVYKIGENGFDYRTAAESLRPGRYPAALTVKATEKLWKVTFSRLPGFEWIEETDFSPAEKRPVTQESIAEAFSSAPLEPWRIDDVKVEIDGSFFVPGSLLKDMRRKFWSAVKAQMPPFDCWFGEQSNALEAFLNADKCDTLSPETVMPREAFVIPAFICEDDLNSVIHELETYFASGKRAVCVTSFHGFAMLKTAPRDVRIFVRFPLPVANHLAADLLAELGAEAFAPEVELDSDSRNQLFAKTTLAHFVDDTPVPLLVTRAALDRTRRTDGSGNTFSVRYDSSEKTSQLFSENTDPASKFEKQLLL